MLRKIPYITVVNDRQISFSVPADLNCISTYILLEQGRWFEKEIDYIYRCISSGMTAIDIGANIGVYALPLAKLVGPDGHVVVYEPGATNRQHLERALTENQCVNVLVSGAALSDRAGTGWLKIDNSGELNQLVAEHSDPNTVESVEISTLDHELERFGWARVDFMKIDAEGQEQAILTGGERFFERYSPLIMFEIIHASKPNHGLIEAFRSLGFDTYRLLGDGSMLVPTGDLENIAEFELNLFAARPDQARRLAESGLLALPGAPCEFSIAERAEAVAHYCALPFAQALEIDPADVARCPFGGALAAYSAYRFVPALAPGRRLAFLQKAYDDLLAYCETSNSAAALSSLARVALTFGHRRIGLDVLQHLLDTEQVDLDQPFIPSSTRFEDIDGVTADLWFVCSVKEGLELGSSFSSMFGCNVSRLRWLADHEWASDEATKRLVLDGLRLGMPEDELVAYLSRLEAADGKRNASWCRQVRSLMAGC